MVEGQRCEKGSRKIYENLTKKFGSFYSREWKMPKINKKLSKFWLRTFFDCEGWVTCKTHQNRHIGLDSINESGLNQVINALNNLGIKTIKKYNEKRKIYRIYIYGKENLKLFKQQINFLHPEKKKKLEEVLNDYIVYIWNFPKNNKGCKLFVNNKLKEKLKFRKPLYFRMTSKEQENLKMMQNLIKKFYGIDSKVYKCVNGYGTTFYELNITRKEDVLKLIKLQLIPESKIKANLI